VENAFSVRLDLLKETCRLWVRLSVLGDGSLVRLAQHVGLLDPHVSIAGLYSAFVFVAPSEMDTP
jgi:hypothetical protein